MAASSRGGNERDQDDGVIAWCSSSCLLIKPAVRRRRTGGPRSFSGCRRRSAAVPLSTTRPRCISTISPASRRASPRSCVDITTLMPRAAMARITILDRLGGGRIEARGRLVEEQHLGIAGERAREREPLLLAAGQPARRALAELRQARPASSSSSVRAAPVGARDAGARQRIADVGGGAAAEHDRALEHDGAARRRRVRAAAPGHAPAGRLDQAHRDAQQRGLAGAVRPDQHGRRAGAKRRARRGRGS